MFLLLLCIAAKILLIRPDIIVLMVGHQVDTRHVPVEVAVATAGIVAAQSLVIGPEVLIVGHQQACRSIFAG